MRSQGFRSTAGVLPAMVMFMAVNVVVGCRGEQRRQTNSTRAKVEQAECPHDAIVIKVIDSTGNLVKTVDTIPLSGPVTKIPEFHDCQRFIQHVNRYDSVYAIFAAFRLESLPARLKGARDSAESDGKAYRTVPVATIYSYGGEYDPLGIKPGFNCLFLYRKGAQWGAKMIPWGGADDPDCASKRFNPYTAGTFLEARASVRPGFADADYPAAARWDWDSVHHNQYIGIKCGQAWCEVGSSGFTPSGPYLGQAVSFEPGPCGLAPSPMQSTRITKIKGWYDAQELAVSTGAGAIPRPSAVHGFLIPHPALELLNKRWRVNDVKCFYGRWVHVADAVLSGDYKWNLTAGVNKIYFCYGTGGPSDCNVPLSQPPLPPNSKPLSQCDPDPNKPEMRWWALIVSATGRRAFSCVKRTDHSTELEDYRLKHPGEIVEIPGAARWRFLLDDEGTWMSCPTGCCTKQ